MKNYLRCQKSRKSSKLAGRFHGMARSVATFAFGAAVGIFIPAMPASAADQVLPGHVPAVVANLNLQPIGGLEAAKRLNLAIGLPLRDQPGLEALLEQLYDPASANYHQYLTPAQFTERFGPTLQDYQAVTAFAQAHNLTVTRTHPNRVILDVSGSVADIESALHVNMLVYQHPTENRTFYAPDVDPSVDLTTPIKSIEGLNNYALPHPNCIGTPLGDMQNPQPDAGTGSGPGGGYEGYDFRKAYLPGISSSLTGKNQAVGLLEFDGYTNTDIAMYETSNGLPAVPLTNVVVDNFDGVLGSGQQEVTLDIDMAIAMAPGLSQVIVYEGLPQEPNWDDILSQMANDNLAKQLSCSWDNGQFTGQSADPVAEQIFEQMAAQGQSFFAASGDSCAYLANETIPFPNDSPHITVVGGTTLTTSGPGGSWVSETVWNAGNGVGSSGGISTQYPIPTWQMGVRMSSTNKGSTTMRNVPDVAMVADNIFIYLNEEGVSIAGTSCAAPLWAGLAALANQQAAGYSLGPVGFLNPALYAMGEGYFHDITTGGNEWSQSPDQFSATSGYDLCAGWGTPKGNGLINSLTTTCLLTPVGSLNTARENHTATLLPNGLVLVAGGSNANGFTASAELYNPATGLWSTNTDPLTYGRYGHTATLLPNGLVLVAGGENSSDEVDGTEFYDPSGGTWTSTPSGLATQCVGHTATLLSTGQVLVAGGWYWYDGALYFTDLYNPVNQVWSDSTSLNYARYNHTATLLPYGLVLVAGGYNTSAYLASAELRNPVTGTWTMANPLNVARQCHTATMLPNGLVLVAGGYGTSGALKDSELYNP